MCGYFSSGINADINKQLLKLPRDIIADDGAAAEVPAYRALVTHLHFKNKVQWNTNLYLKKTPSDIEAFSVPFINIRFAFVSGSEVICNKICSIGRFHYPSKNVSSPLIKSESCCYLYTESIVKLIRSHVFL